MLFCFRLLVEPRLKNYAIFYIYINKSGYHTIRVRRIFFCSHFSVEPCISCFQKSPESEYCTNIHVQCGSQNTSPVKWFKVRNSGAYLCFGVLITPRSERNDLGSDRDLCWESSIILFRASSTSAGALPGRGSSVDFLRSRIGDLVINIIVDEASSKGVEVPELFCVLGLFVTVLSDVVTQTSLDDEDDEEVPPTAEGDLLFTTLATIGDTLRSFGTPNGRSKPSSARSIKGDTTIELPLG